MKSKSKIPEEEKLALLPPCTICSAKSSGLHFGVNTCEACKAFFRRCLNRRKETPLTCIGEGQCEVDINKTKTLCSSCRYEKCIKNGMSKSAIKTGRYSLERKADLIREAKSKSFLPDEFSFGTLGPDLPSGLLLTNAVETPGGNRMPNNTPAELPFATESHPGFMMSSSQVLRNSIYPEEQVCIAPQRQLQTVDVSGNMTSTTVVSSLSSCVMSPNASMCTQSTSYSNTCSPISNPFSPGKGIQQNFPARDNAVLQNYFPLTPESSPSNVACPSQTISSNIQNLNAPNQGQSTVNDLVDASVATTQDLDQIIRLVAAAYERYGPFPDEMRDEFLQSQMKYKEQQEFLSDLFGPMKPLDVEEYLDIYNNTGIDVDGRKAFALKLYPNLDANLRRLIGFVKCIPGFTDINIDDQIELIRGGSIDWLLIVASAGMDLKHNITNIFGLTFDVDEFWKLHSTIPTAFCEIIKRIKRLDLDNVSMGLLAAFYIIDPDHNTVQIKNKEEVAAVQYSLMEAFALHLSRTYRRHLWVFSQAMLVHNIIRQQRSTINRDRISSHGQCTKFGVHITPLMQSVVYNRPVNLVESILKDGAKSNDKVDSVPTQSTMYDGPVSLVESILKDNAESGEKVENSVHITPPMQSVQYNRPVDLVEPILKDGAKSNDKVENSVHIAPPMQSVVYNRPVDLVESILKDNAESGDEVEDCNVPITMEL